MPYNNTPIAPPTDVTGATSLPLARVKKIITSDPDISTCSNNAAFLVTVATEMFLQYLVEQTHNVVRSDRTNNNKPRRNLQYRDVANAVARIDNLEFLSDVVPKTMTFKALKEKEAKEGKTGGNMNGVAGRGGSMNGQRTLDGRGALADDDAVDEGAEQGEDVEEEVNHGIAEEMKVDDSALGKSESDDPDSAAVQYGVEPQGAKTNGALEILSHSPMVANGNA
ncbi:hypothetical protein LTR16_003081 [Cryomyces antarcticus]|uniref:Transcription factor CBF/NF-Y/archaeal histone domain-containing protein n=1 Tax=Cryomyces antarcticus TaxID=329879 RepID=A0ABR0M743_9PEZI|nr:hypothetical protein LTR16_003081 [Cryomyces antarcticus]